jgi:hypothetical protein
MEIIIYNNSGGDSVLRLVALGLMIEITNNSIIEEDGNGGFN